MHKERPQVEPLDNTSGELEVFLYVFMVVFC